VNVPKIALILDELPEHRLPFLGKLSRVAGLDVHTAFCRLDETQRALLQDATPFDHTCLQDRATGASLSTSSVAPENRKYHGGIGRFLAEYKPDAIVTNGFAPAQLMAFATAWFRGIPHVAMTEASYASEHYLGPVHHAVRNFVYTHSATYICASLGGQRLFESHGIPVARCFRSCIAVDNETFAPQPGVTEVRPFDFIFCGRMGEVENPMFVLHVAAETARLLQRKLRVLLVGTGKMESIVHDGVARRDELVEAEFVSFHALKDKAALFRSARVLLFPALHDPWGVAINEACAAGVPVIVTPETGAAGELVRDGENGFICQLNVALWAGHAAQLLNEPETWANYSARCRWLVGEYNHDRSVSGFVNACRYAFAIQTMMPMNKAA
jgi:glycosyltransferase involved in cell wall biosynthesis